MWSSISTSQADLMFLHPIHPVPLWFSNPWRIETSVSGSPFYNLIKNPLKKSGSWVFISIIPTSWIEYLMPFCRFWNFQNTWVCESSEAWWSISNPASTCRQYPHVLDQCKERTPSGHPYLNHLSGSFDLWMVYLLPRRLTPFKIPFDHPYQSFIYLWSPEDGFFLRRHI